MKQLTGLDANFLNMETGRSFGHVNSLSIYELPPDNPDFSPYEAYRELLEGYVGVIEPLRRRLVEVPLGLDRPYWVIDPDFDLDFHVRHIGVPAPGGIAELTELVARLIGRPMDRSRPLWEVYVIEGLEGGDFGVMTKIHHATIDGAAGAEMTSIMLNAEPDGPAPVPVAWEVERLPSNAELLSRTAVAMTRQPIKAVRVQVRLLRELAKVTRNANFDNLANSIRRGVPGPAGAIVGRILGADAITDDDDEAPVNPGIMGPKTPFNATITPHRRLAVRTTQLADIKAIKTALGCTLNDVVMAVCAGALRRYLELHDALPEENLRAMIPVSIRTGDEEDKWTNRVSAIFSAIPTTVADPLERVAAVSASMTAAKSQFDLLPADTIAELSELAPPALAIRASRVAARARLADRTNPPANLVISNVPGPRQSLYLHGGARLKHYYPVSTVVDGQGLNITVQSYCDGLDWGLVSCRELVPDLWTLMDYITEEISLLADAAGVTLVGDSAPKKSAPKKVVAKKAAPKKVVAKKRAARKTAAKKTVPEKVASTSSGNA